MKSNRAKKRAAANLLTIFEKGKHLRDFVQTAQKTLQPN